MGTKFEDLRGGLTVDEALEGCRDGYLRGRLPQVVTAGLFDGFAAHLRVAIPGRITDAQAAALSGLVARTLKTSWPEILAWIKKAPDLPLEEFQAAFKAEARALAMHMSGKSYAEWQMDPHPDHQSQGVRIEPRSEAAVAAAKTRHGTRLPSCFSCGTLSHALNWRYAKYDAINGVKGTPWAHWVVTCEQCKLLISLITDFDG